MTKAQKTERDEALTFLRKHLRPGQEVYTTLTHVSRSGMQRSIRVFVVGRDRIPFDISGWVGRAIGWKRDDKRGGVKVNGCGMDMGFHLVYSLSWAMFPNGTSKPHGTRNGEPDTNGGYALKQRWL